MSRYSLPDPKCRHKATVRISSHLDLQAGFEGPEPFASTCCCDREECQADAKAWLWASTHREAVHVVPLRRAQ
jgi:hypothetical protein